MRRESVLLPIFLAACQEGSIHPGPEWIAAGLPADPATPRHVDRIVQTTPRRVDVLWVLDDSCSMYEEQSALGTNFPAFLDFFLDSGLDWHIGLVSTDTYDPARSGRLVSAAGRTYIDPDTPSPEAVFAQMTKLGTGGSPVEKGLLAAYWALAAPSPAVRDHNAGFVRPDAELHVIVISDEDDQSGSQLTQAEFVNFLRRYKRDADLDVSFSSIVGPVPSGCWSGMGTASPAPRYLSVSSLTSGVMRSICEEDWVPLLEDLGLRAAGQRHEYFLSKVPVPESLVVWVLDDDQQYEGVDTGRLEPGETLESACERQGAYGCFPYHYDPVRNSIVMERAFVPGAFAEVFVEYELMEEQQRR